MSLSTIDCDHACCSAFEMLIATNVGGNYFRPTHSGLGDIQNDPSSYFSLLLKSDSLDILTSRLSTGLRSRLKDHPSVHGRNGTMSRDDEPRYVFPAEGRSWNDIEWLRVWNNNSQVLPTEDQAYVTQITMSVGYVRI
jgi:hypothetical protein